MEKKKFDTCVQEADSELALNNCQAQSAYPKGCIYIFLSAFSNTLSLKSTLHFTWNKMITS